MTNNAIGSMPGTIPEQMTATGMKQPPSFTLVWSSAGPGCAPVPAHHVRRKPRIPKIWLIFALITTLVIVSPTILKFLLDLQPGDHTATVTEHTGYTGCTWSSFYLRPHRWWL